VVNDLQQRIERQVKLPPGYYVDYGGAFKNLEAARSRLLIAVPVSLLLILLLLYFAFGSLPQALLVFTAIPLSAIGGVLALWLRQLPFSISAGVGFIALFGVAVLNGIVLISEFNRVQQATKLPMMEVILQATRIRFRPVLLTASVASLGFLPMALSHAPGAEVQRPLASVVIGGLVSATFLTLIVLPILYYWLHQKANFTMKKINPVAMVIVLLLAGTPVQAQQSMTLSEALQLLPSANPEQQLANLDKAYQQRLVATAGSMPKTKFQAEMGQTNSANFDTRLSAIQTFNPFGLRKNEAAWYQSGVAVLQQQTLLRQAELRYLVRSIYTDYFWLEAGIQQRRQLDTLYQRLTLLSRQRKEAGEVSALEEEGFNQQHLMLQQELMQAQIEQQKLQAQLQVILHTSFTPVPAGSLQDDWGMPLLPDTALLAGHPALQVQQEIRNQLQKEKEWIRSQRKPELELGYNNQSLIGFQTLQNGTEKYYNAADRFSTGQLGLSVPIFGKTWRAREEAAAIREKRAEKAIDLALFSNKAQIQELLKVHRLLQQQLNQYRSQILPGAEKMVRLADQQLKAGALNYINWLVLAGPAIQMPLQYFQKQRELKLNEAQLAYFSENQTTLQ
jgi:cobalt-zinc-cadmium resistance protein CzcA